MAEHVHVMCTYTCTRAGLLLSLLGGDNMKFDNALEKEGVASARELKRPVPGKVNNDALTTSLLAASYSRSHALTHCHAL